VTLWVGREFREELEAVRALLSHVVPSRKKEDVLLQVLRAQRKLLERRRHGSSKRSSRPAAAADAPPATSADERHIPAAVRRAVYEREDVRCKQLERRGQPEQAVGAAAAADRERSRGRVAGLGRCDEW